MAGDAAEPQKPEEYPYIKFQIDDQTCLQPAAACSQELSQVPVPIGRVGSLLYSCIEWNKCPQ
jgi:hypothetical protein